MSLLTSSGRGAFGAPLAILERYTTRPRLLWTSVAVRVLVLSFVPVLAVEATASAKLYLALMHLAVGAVLVRGMSPESKERK